MTDDQVKDEDTEAAVDAISDISPQGFCIAINFFKPSADFLMITYPTEWMSHYAKTSLILEDPTISYAKDNNGVITWDELRLLFPGSRTFIESKKFGMEKGTTLVTEIDGVKSIVSGAGMNWDRRQVRTARIALHTVHLMNAKTRRAA